MDYRRIIQITTMASALASAGCAVSPDVQARRDAVEAEIQEILSQPLDEAQYGTTRRCLSESDFRRYYAINDRYLVFEGREDRRWINELRSRCGDLRWGEVLVVTRRSAARQLCALDSFQSTDWFHWPWYRRWPWQWGSSWGTGMTCTLGEFKPVTEAQLDQIEDLLESE